MILDDLGSQLAASGLGLTVATNLFLGVIDGKIDNGVAIYETPGAPPIRAMRQAFVAERPRVQVMVRNLSYRTARQLAQNIVTAIDGLSDQTINGTRYMLITAVSSPFSLGQDTSGRHRIVTSFDIIKATSTSTST